MNFCIYILKHIYLYICIDIYLYVIYILHKDVYKHILSNFIHNNQRLKTRKKQEILSKERWINKLFHSHTVKYYSEVKRGC